MRNMSAFILGVFVLRNSMECVGGTFSEFGEESGLGMKFGEEVGNGDLSRVWGKTCEWIDGSMSMRNVMPLQMANI